MKTIFLIVLLGTWSTVIGQDTKKTKYRISPTETETFFVLKSDGTTKSGPYELFENKRLKASGQYINDKREGPWKEFYSSGGLAWSGSYHNDEKSGEWIGYHDHTPKKLRLAQGHFDEGERVGVWSWFNQKDSIIQQYDFDSGQLLVGYMPLKSKTASLATPSPVLYFADTLATFGEDEGAIYRFLGRNITYPNRAKESSIQGKVFVRFVVEADGSVSHVQVLRGIGSGCDKEAVRVVTLTGGKWTPAMLDNKLFPSLYTIPIHFKLN